MGIKTKMITFIDKLPYVRTLKKKVKFYENELMVPPGHFYSPIANQEELLASQQRIFDVSKPYYGVELNEAEQFQLLNSFTDHYNMLPFTDSAVQQNRYYYQNDAYSYADAVFLFSMMMQFKPKRIIEIGSGYSSALMLDTNEHFFQQAIDITLIEPFPETLKRVTRPGDQFTLIEKMVQDVDLAVFKTLEENDILFIDSTHVAKTNSDVLYELFEILPNLKKGVKIHVHDIFFPFEYPKEWVIDQKRNWNEIYFLKAFLMYNNHFRILAYNTFLEHRYTSWFEEHMPLCLKNRGGSIWLEKTMD